MSGHQQALGLPDLKPGGERFPQPVDLALKSINVCCCGVAVFRRAVARFRSRPASSSRVAPVIAGVGPIAGSEVAVRSGEEPVDRGGVPVLRVLACGTISRRSLYVSSQRIDVPDPRRLIPHVRESVPAVSDLVAFCRERPELVRRQFALPRQVLALAKIRLSSFQRTLRVVEVLPRHAGIL